MSDTLDDTQVREMQVEVEFLRRMRMSRLERRIESAVRRWARDEFGLDASVEPDEIRRENSIRLNIEIAMPGDDEIPPEYRYVLTVNEIEDGRFEIAPTPV